MKFHDCCRAENLPEECQKYRYAYFECRRGMVRNDCLFFLTLMLKKIKQIQSEILLIFYFCEFFEKARYEK